MPPSHALQLIPYAEEPLAALAARLLADHRSQLPRLERVVVVLPEIEAAPRLRQLLLTQAAGYGHTALLGPRITTLREWLDATPLAHDFGVVSEHQRPLILIEALRGHRTLFGEGNLWALADTLLRLFDELTLNQVALPADITEFTRRITAGYGLPATPPDALDREARLVHTLWHAWHQQLHARRLIDQHSRYLLQLSQSLRHPPQTPIYMAAGPTLTSAEQQWVAQMVERGALTLLLQGEGGPTPERLYHPATPLHTLFQTLQHPVPQKEDGSPANHLFDTVYTPEEDIPLLQRAQRFALLHPASPLSGRLHLFHADGDEQEARAVELQVRRWLLEGLRQIAIVTENRRLARRVRALLERAGLMLHDASGWALSTTSAAATLEQWLECVEDDFTHQPMLDLLKSPFIRTPEGREHHLNQVYRLEQDIVQHENIGRCLERYLRQTRFRQHRLPTELAMGLEGVIALLQRLEGAVAPLLPLLRGERPAAYYLGAMLQSLTPLGIEDGLLEDAAGMQLLELLQQMQAAVEGETQQITWLEFRGWLGRTLEQSHFRPPRQGQQVILMGLGQSGLQRFDALILAGMEQEHMPGPPASSPFFNDAVRRELNLPCGQELQAQRLFHFRRLLEAAPQQLLTLRHQQDGEEIAPSPWLEALRSFHLIAYGEGLEAHELARLVTAAETQVVERGAPLPAPVSPPAPALPPSLLPRLYSASAYQQLLNCPYQFFAARGLGLAPPEAIREALEKSDYGERVHRILQAFHGRVAGLPGPFAKRLDAQTRGEAQQLLESISRAVFAEDLEDNFLHRGWLQRWLEKIPEYLAWQLAREEGGRVEGVEAELRTASFDPDFELYGRLDRIDRLEMGKGVVDYKTGGIASEAEVLSGEAVQLPFYALLAQQQMEVSQVEYLALDGGKLASRGALSDAPLQQLRDGIGERLRQLHRQMGASHGLPAWGDEGVCGYCHMEGLCRRGAWSIPETPEISK